MSDEEFAKEVADLVDLLNSLRLIKDKGRAKWLRAEIRSLVIKLTKP